MGTPVPDDLRAPSDNDLRAYLREVMAIPLLNHDHELLLFREIELGGPQADHLRRRVVEANLRLAVAVARRYRGRGLPLFDLIMEANVGLLRAVDRYDFRRGFTFSTYAVWWMRKAIVDALESYRRAQS